MIHPILLAVWGVLAACFLGLLIYRGQLTRYEEEQLFLHHDGTAQEEEQSSIVRRVRQLQPIMTITGAAAALVTASVVGIYVYAAWQRIPQ